MIRYAIALLLTFAASQVARGAAGVTMNYNGAAGESNVVDSLGQAINGDTVSIGTFTSGFDPTANANNLSALQANWLNFDSTTTTTIRGVDGRFAATSPAIDNPLFDNQKIYLFVTEPGGGGGVSEYGLFSSTDSIWIFPVHDSGLPTDILSSDEVNQYYFGQYITTTGTPDTPGSLQTLPTLVPEPGVLSLLSIGLVLGLLRRHSR